MFVRYYPKSMRGTFLIFCMKLQQNKGRKLGKIILTKYLFLGEKEAYVSYFLETAAWRFNIGLSNCFLFVCFEKNLVLGFFAETTLFSSELKLIYNKLRTV